MTNIHVDPGAASPLPAAEIPRGVSALSRSLAALRKHSRRKDAVAHCEMCSQPLPDTHPHLLEIGPQRLLCACDACALLFSVKTADAKYRRVSRRLLSLPDFRLSDAQWAELLIPIDMAFIFYSAPRDRAVALYPSPAGAIESLLELESWKEIVAQNQVLETMEPDVEALLIDRVPRLTAETPPAGTPDARYFLAPIDECFKLVGVIRANWRGLSGGKQVWNEIDAFFVDLRARSRIVSERLEQGPTQCPT